MVSFLEKTGHWTKSMIRRIGGKDVSLGRALLVAAACLVLLFLSLYRLGDYPLTWFDEGSHLHVPKALVMYGAYADYSSEGFRYYGPTNGVGATVMLPIAGMFKLFGIGLLQARLFMVVYLLAALYLFYRLAVQLGGEQMAWAAVFFLVASRGVLIIEYGRQVLGEVPALAFLLGGLLAWWNGWQKPAWRSYLLAGLLFGLSTVTKSQFLLVVGPVLVLAWIANMIYYRLLPHRAFIVPGLVTGFLFGAWQLYLLFGIDPQAQFGNFALLAETSGSAAFVFSMDLIRRAVNELLSIRGYFGLVGLILVYGVSRILPRRIESLKWGVIWALAVVNLVWYVFASVSWLRYAFIGLSLSSLFLARLFVDLAENLRTRLADAWKAIRRSEAISSMEMLRFTVLVVMAALGVVSLALNARDVVVPKQNAPFQMAAYLDQNVAQDVVIETYEPEMGFLTDHRYHFPPHRYLNQTIQSVWMEGPRPGEDYQFIKEEKPEYILIGAFSTWVNFYSTEAIEKDYTLVVTIGPYLLYKSNDLG